MYILKDLNVPKDPKGHPYQCQKRKEEEAVVQTRRLRLSPVRSINACREAEKNVPNRNTAKWVTDQGSGANREDVEEPATNLKPLQTRRMHKSRLLRLHDYEEGELQHGKHHIQDRV